jgi:hypothetical protein
MTPVRKRQFESGLAMFDPDFLTYAALGGSLSVSLIQICRWLLNASPRAIVNAGQWLVAGFIGLTPALLLFLIMSGRSTLALTLTASIFPALIWSAPRWRTLLGSLGSLGNNAPGWTHNFGASDTAIRPEPINPDLVRQSIIVLTAYLELAASQSGSKPTRAHSTDRLLNGPRNGDGRRKMSIEEALDILDLEATAGPHQISEAHQRLQQKLKPELGDTHYLIARIDEAMDVLLKQ